MYAPGTMEDHLDRLERARESLNTLIREAKANNHGAEFDRLYAKREGVMLAISYAREALRQKATWLADIHGAVQTPPWVLVVELPEGTPPTDARFEGTPGSQITAFCGGLAESVLRVAKHASAGPAWKGE